ncbi:DinB family protein [Acidobacteria bacterium AH-259-G07]|nr:DinB family protein [Acidobacteria bacterium AH-259-G07]
MDRDKSLRNYLRNLLDGKSAHVSFDQAITDLSSEIRGQKTPALPYTIWQLFEHMRIAQWDILEFSRNSEHVSPEWPGGYWPESEAPSDDSAWQNSIEAFRSDLQAMKDLVSDPSIDLFAPIPHGDGQAILREALLVADHNVYHLGQIVLIRKMLGAWDI